MAIAKTPSLKATILANSTSSFSRLFGVRAPPPRACLRAAATEPRRDRS
jgi:hypothetical protein